LNLQRRQLVTMILNITTQKGTKIRKTIVQCGKNWTPRHRCEDPSLHYFKIVDEREVEILNPENEITISYNSKSNNDETLPKVSLSSISCTPQNKNEDRVPQKKLLFEKNKLQNIFHLI
jgi:hypothetical protein